MNYLSGTSITPFLELSGCMHFMYGMLHGVECLSEYKDLVYHRISWLASLDYHMPVNKSTLPVAGSKFLARKQMEIYIVDNTEQLHTTASDVPCPVTALS